ncbi:DUF5995 family protein [Nocardia sp. NPDC005366]|uniref:DUF5995 family protein n=1 Tax=Nocardia sp. NPDC005366 TaxID=3156878 RepID=UPI0033A64555
MTNVRNRIHLDHRARPTAAARRLGVLSALLALLAAFTLGTPAAAQVDQACGTPLSAAEVDAVVGLSDTAALVGPSMRRLEQAVDNHRQLTEILVRHRDRRGLFPLGLDEVERAAVLPLQRDPSAFDDPEWAHRISLELLSRFLDNVHAEFSGAPVQAHWARYFDLTRQCDLSPARVAMAGYNAHLSVDLAYSFAAVHGTPANAADYFRIVDAIAQRGQLIVSSTERVYGGDLGPLWRFYFLGEGLDAVFGAGVGSGALLRLADAGANVAIFTNGLALQDPVLAPATELEIDALWRSADIAFEVLAGLGGL